MGCLFNKNSKREVTSASLENGSQSILFDKLVKNIHFNNEQAVSLYQNIYSKKFEKKFGKWEINNTEINNENNGVEEQPTYSNLNIKQQTAIKQLSEGMKNPVVLYKGRDGKQSIDSIRVNAHPDVQGQFYTTDYEVAKTYGRITGVDVFVVDDINSETVKADGKLGLSKARQQETDLINNSRKPLVYLDTVDVNMFETQVIVKDSNILKNVGGREAVIEETGEPKLFYLTPSNLLTTDYKTALSNTTNGNIKMGFITSDDILLTKDKGMFDTANNDVVVFKDSYKLNNSEAFLESATIDSNSNPNTYNGFLNYLIRRGSLSSEKVLFNGVYNFKGEGELESTQLYNAYLAYEQALMYVGRNNVKIDKFGNLSIQDGFNGKVKMTTKNGNQVELDEQVIYQDLLEGKFNQYNSKYDGFPYIAMDLLVKNNDFFNNEDLIEESQENNRSDKDLRVILLNTLSKMGVAITSISDYVKNYNIRNSIDPSVEALADISKQVVAFAQGYDTLDNISEETSHFIIEAYNNQDLIEELLPQVENTEEWKE
ncbi:MAG: hypothetical protein KC414_01335, partial [Romboutsia sp.]|nr:hypothetical protein [Romboutsia sp.]